MQVNVFALYFAQKELKRPMFAALRALPAAFLTSPSLLIGDFNTGLHESDEMGSTFVCADEFQELMRHGWIDAWRHHHGTKTEYTWYSSKGGGFRIDHLFASPAAIPNLRFVHYSHAERRPDLSDHSMLVAEYCPG